MIKKVEKKKKRLRYRGFSLRFNNTITLSIMFVIIVTVSIVELIMYVFSQDSVKSLQNELSADFISNLQVFNKDLYTKNFSSIQTDLNNVLSGSYIVNYVVILNSDMEEVYNSLSKDSQYIFRTPNNPATFKLKFAPDIDRKNVAQIKTIYNW